MIDFEFGIDFDEIVSFCFVTMHFHPFLSHQKHHSALLRDHAEADGAVRAARVAAGRGRRRRARPADAARPYVEGEGSGSEGREGWDQLGVDFEYAKNANGRNSVR